MADLTIADNIDRVISIIEKKSPEFWRACVAEVRLESELIAGLWVLIFFIVIAGMVYAYPRLKNGLRLDEVDVGLMHFWYFVVGLLAFVLCAGIASSYVPQIVHPELTAAQRVSVIIR